MRNRNALLLIISYGLIVGAVNTYSGLVGLITADYGYSDAAASLMGAIFIGGSLIGSVLFGIWVEIKKNYKMALIILSVGTACFPFGLAFALPTGKLALPCIACFCIGFFGLTVLPIGIDFGVELTYPSPEAVSSGLLLTAANFFGTIFSVAGAVMIG